MRNYAFIGRTLILFVFFQVGERIRVILDCDDNTLSFEKNYEFLGVAFRGKSQVLSCLLHGVIMDFSQTRMCTPGKPQESYGRTIFSNVTRG